MLYDLAVARLGQRYFHMQFTILESAMSCVADSKRILKVVGRKSGKWEALDTQTKAGFGNDERTDARRYAEEKATYDQEKRLPVWDKRNGGK